jgi:hypothetical protein
MSQSMAHFGNKFAETHGHTWSVPNKGASPTHRSWQGMKQRCLNPKHVAYARYGGRGIKIDSRWLRFENFLVDMGVRPEGKTLNRKDNDGDYTKDNCNWATDEEQYSNKTHRNQFMRNPAKASLQEIAPDQG